MRSCSYPPRWRPPGRCSPCNAKPRNVVGPPTPTSPIALRNQSRPGGHSIALLEEQKRTEAQIREQQRYRDSLVSNLPGMVFRCQNDLEWTMTYVSEGCLALTGYTRSELEQNRVVSFGSLVHANDQQWLWSSCQRSLAERRPCNHEYRIINQSGETRWVWERANGLYSPEGALLCIEGFVTDVTARKEAELERQVMLERYNSIFTSVAEGLLLVRSDGGVVECNAAAEAILGLRREDILDGNSSPARWNIVGADGQPLAEADRPSRITFRTGRAVRGFALGLHRSDGSFVSLLVNAEPIREAGTRVTHVVVSFTDITLQLRTAEAKRVADTRLQAAVVASRMVWWEWQLSTGVFHLNALGAPCVLGFADGQLAGITGTGWIDRVHPSERAEVARSLQETLDGRNDQWVCDHRLLTADDSWRWMRNMGRVTERTADGAPKVMAGTTQDTHDYHLADQTSKANARRLHVALGASHMGTLSFNLQTSVAEWDERTREIFGVTGEGIPASETALRAVMHPEDRDGFTATWAALRAGQKTFEFTFRVIRAADDVRTIRCVGTVQPDKHGNPEWLTGITEDITHRVRADATRRLLEAQLVESQKLETIGTLAGGVAHDFNNLLTSILGFVDLSMQAIPDHHEITDYLKHTQNAGLRARDLVKRLLLFARRGPEALRQAVALQKLVAETTKLLTATLPASISLRADITPDIPPVLADAGQIQQVLMNLCVNAAHAIGKHHGEITLGARLTSVRPGDGLSCAPGPYVCLTVADNGCGMDQSTQAKIFDPFFTTKPQGEGTGLGLSIVHGVVHQHGGTILVQSAPAAGSRFDIYLPVASEQLSPAGVPPPMAALLDGRRRRVLVAEDEEPIRRMLGHVLKEAGFEVELCEDGQAAAERFAVSPESFALVLTDLSMPRRTGIELITDLQARRRDIPIILMSGDAQRYGGDPLRYGRQFVQLAKPFLPDEMLAAVRKLVDASPSSAGF